MVYYFRPYFYLTLKKYAEKIGFFLGPLAFIFILIIGPLRDFPPQGQSVFAATLWIAIWWITEAIPIAATALLPIILFPLSGGMELSSTTAAFGHKYVFLYFWEVF